MSDKFVSQTVKFKLNERSFSFTVIHNMNMRQYGWPQILDNWSARLESPKDATVENLCEYINSKKHMTGCMAFTEKQFEELRKNPTFK